MITFLILDQCFRISTYSYSKTATEFLFMFRIVIMYVFRKGDTTLSSNAHINTAAMLIHTGCKYKCFDMHMPKSGFGLVVLCRAVNRKDPVASQRGV